MGRPVGFAGAGGREVVVSSGVLPVVVAVSRTLLMRIAVARVTRVGTGGGLLAALLRGGHVSRASLLLVGLLLALFLKGLVSTIVLGKNLDIRETMRGTA